MSDESDPPIIIVGGPQMINVEVRRSSTNQAAPETFSVEPEDPKLPFKEIVIWDGQTLVKRWPLSQEWKIEIV